MQTTMFQGGKTMTGPGFGITHMSPQGGGGGDTGAAAIFGSPGQFAGAMGNAYTGMAGWMGGIGNSFANLYGSNAAALASLAQARANEESDRRSASAMAEAARQGAIGNIGSSALGAYGGAANSALAAWAANQQAYNQSLASMHGADQQAMSQYGTGRNSALAALAAQYGTLGKAQIGANALSNIDFNMSGSMPTGMSAVGPDGAIAGGSYSPMTFSGGGSRRSSGGGGGESAFAGLDALRGDMMSQDVMDRMTGQAQSGAGRLDSQHYSSRGMPSQMLGETLSGLLQLQNPAYQNMNTGMNQFYANNGPSNGSFYDKLMGDLKSGYGDARKDITGAGNQISGGFGTVMKGMNDLWDKSMGRLPVFSGPSASAARDQARIADQQRHVAALMDNPRLDAGRRQYLQGRMDRLGKQAQRF